MPVLGLPEVAADPRFATSPLRVAHRRELVDALTPALKTRTTDEWLDRLGAADILCARVASYADVARHPQVAANAMLAEVAHPVHGRVRMPGFPVNSGRANAVPHRPAPACGEHTRQVLRDGGYGDDEVDALLRAGVIRCKPLASQPTAAA